MKVFLLACLATTLLAGCSKKEAAPQPADPAAEISLTRTMVFPSTGTSNGVGYAPTSLEATGKLDATQLVLSVDAPKGQDYIGFTVPRSALSPDLLGSYSLLSLQAPGASVDTWYTYWTVRTSSVSAAHIYLSKNSNMQGRLLITAYDSQRRLLSGSFEMRMADLADPTEEIASSNPRRCTLDVTGTFTNLKLQ